MNPNEKFILFSKLLKGVFKIFFQPLKYMNRVQFYQWNYEVAFSFSVITYGIEKKIDMDADEARI